MNSQADETFDRIDAVRRFNRFYTRELGLLTDKVLGTGYSLLEARLMFEISHAPGITAKALCSDLRLDPGQASRMLKKLEKDGLIERRRSEVDGRERLLSLSQAGATVFARLNEGSRTQIGALLGDLPETGQERLVDAMTSIESLLSGAPEPANNPVVIRHHRPGDIGWIVQRHGEIYNAEYGWDERFEALVAGIMARFVESYDPAKERCWIAESQGKRLGAIMAARIDDETAQLRVLIVEPDARGLGLGRTLVETCIGFAQQARYKKMRLWTDNILDAARHIYKQAGFKLIDSKPHADWGEDLIGEIWELDL